MNKQTIVEQSLGKLQIYVEPRDKIEATGLMNRLRSRQLYRELVKYEKEEDLMSASVYQTQHGYSLRGKIRSSNVEVGNINLSLCVELIDEKHKLEAFCKKHAKVLKGKMIVFKAVEFWEIK